jgi:YegS/Rv2252/BmrU family lipid kinase
VNPISGTRDKKKLIKTVVEVMQLKGISFEILETNAKGDYEFLLQKIEQEKITDIVICGGDGTVNQVVVYLLNTPIQIGIIPVGSGNGLAFAAGISHQITKAIDVILQNKTSVIDGFQVNEHFGCMLTGLGFDARVAEAFSHEKKRGLFTYLILCTKHFFKSVFYPFLIQVEGQALKTEAFFVSVANSNQFGNHVTIAPQASLSDGLLDVVIVTKMNPFFTVVYTMRQILLGKVQDKLPYFSKKKNVYYLQAKEITIDNPTLAPLHIDGEPKATSSSIRIKLIPKAIRLLVP